VVHDRVIEDVGAAHKVNPITIFLDDDGACSIAGPALVPPGALGKTKVWGPCIRYMLSIYRACAYT